MKTWLSIFATLVVVLCVIGITALTGAGDAVPTILPTVALGAFAGAYALVSLPTWGDLAVGVFIIAAIVVLSLLHDVIPTSLGELLVVALAGHLALSVPDAPATVTVLPAPAAPKVAAPAAPTVMIGGQ